MVFKNEKIIVNGKCFIDIDSKNLCLIAYYEIMAMNYLRNVPTSYDVYFYAYMM